MLGCFFGRKPQPEIDLLLRVLDSSNLDELAVLYGEARDRFENPELMAAIDKRMDEVIARQPTQKEA